ncbi:SH2 domain-containing protein [Planoprotostelium fungivorum]|uniref:non-specific serine/threonine protein kinase n=1 Tax=Planoprotostelium fungivorum TaxID=1890364 RepID=A0A2P6N8D9_9EUKA|nr:SH2 domain-containing protein [Planoprotostelium fungivorum]
MSWNYGNQWQQPSYNPPSDYNSNYAPYGDANSGVLPPNQCQTTFDPYGTTNSAPNNNSNYPYNYSNNLQQTDYGNYPSSYGYAPYNSTTPSFPSPLPVRPTDHKVSTYDTTYPPTNQFDNQYPPNPYASPYANNTTPSQSSYGAPYPPSTNTQKPSTNSYPSSNATSSQYPPSTASSTSYPPSNAYSSPVKEDSNSSYPAPPMQASYGTPTVTSNVTSPISASTSTPVNGNAQAAGLQRLENQQKKDEEEKKRLELLMKQKEDDIKRQYGEAKLQKEQELARMKEDMKRLELQLIQSEEAKIKSEQEAIRKEEQSLQVERERLKREEQLKKDAETARLEREQAMKEADKRHKEQQERTKQEMEKATADLQEKLRLQQDWQKNKMAEEEASRKEYEARTNAMKAELENERKRREEYEQQIAKQKQDAELAAAAAAAAAAELPPPILLGENKDKGRMSNSLSGMTEIEPKDVVMGQVIGKGAFGEVSRARLHGKEVAVKKLIVQQLDDQSLQSFRDEVRVMSTLRHPNILLFMGACTQPGHLMIVTEIASGSIDRAIRDKVNPPSFKQRLVWARDTALGVNWLHCMRPPFLHLDLKSGNLLIDQYNTVKVSDFGLSAVKHTEGSRGTPLWMSPEMLLEKPFNEKTDVYSYGITLWEIFTGGIPFDNAFESFDDLVDAVCLENERPKLPAWLPTRLSKLISSCWDMDADRRPSFTQILADDQFQRILVDFYLPDQASNDFWSLHFLEMDVVEWPLFLEKYAQYFHLDINSLRDTKTAQLQILVGDNRQSLVSIEQFAQAVSILGFNENMPASAATLLSYKWFWGIMRRGDEQIVCQRLTDADETDRLLNKQNAGTWLLRFEPEDASQVVISVKGTTVEHHAITAKNGKLTFKNNTFTSLESIINKYSKELSMVVACPGSRFGH